MTRASACAYDRTPMPEEAVLALASIRVNGTHGQLYAYRDRVELVTSSGRDAVPLTSVARITTKSGLVRGRIQLTMMDGQVVWIRGLRARDAAVAYRVLVDLASDANRS